ncbi:MAG TPA: ABC transporter substrate-binding protein [Xanthobacteraceae bacterium]|nr:ABC transporter substrate-binding protein [Xanthobacteraceae bacterium]
MKRREFITLLGGAAAAWPLAARAQQPALPVIGFVYPGAPELSAGVVAAFRKGLNETGFVEGRNVTVEFRFAYNDNARLPELVGDLVQRGVAVITTPASTPAALAAKAATTTVPVVFSVGADPVEIGLVAGLNRPGGNATGITSMNAELGPKRLGLLHELLPRAVRFAVLLNPNNRNIDALTRDLQATASAIGKQVDVLTAKSTREIDAAFLALSQRPADALVITPDQLLDNRRVQLVTLVTHYRLPTIYPFRENVEIGGLMSYGSSAAERDRQVGIYTGRILKGEKPADLPVIRAAKFEFVVNLQTAKVLGLDVPATLLASADEVIE